MTTDELIETLERLEKRFLLPVSPSWLHDAIRHYARNVEWDMPDDGSALDRYAGSDVATVLNHLPALISALKENKRLLAWEQAHADAMSALRLQLRGAREALVEARAAIQDWGSYAGKYFQEKHDLAGDLARIDAALQPQGEK